VSFHEGGTGGDLRIRTACKQNLLTSASEETSMANIGSEDLQAKLARQSEEIDKITHELLQKAHREIQITEDRLSETHKRILGYFWNNVRKEHRDYIPLSVIYFFETENSISQLRSLDESKINPALSELVVKKYIKKDKLNPDTFNFIVRDEDIITLTNKGTRLLDQWHPRPLVWWTRILDSLPDWATLLVVTIGVVAGILGIVDFVDKFFTHVLNQ
jgi:hypothetical protein